MKWLDLHIDENVEYLGKDPLTRASRKISAREDTIRRHEIFPKFPDFYWEATREKQDNQNKYLKCFEERKKTTIVADPFEIVLIKSITFALSPVAVSILEEIALQNIGTEL